MALNRRSGQVDRSEKEALVAHLGGVFEQASLVVVTKQTGMTVEESTALRRDVREVGAGYKVTKNRITKIALQGTQFEGLAPHFKGPTAIAYSEDPVAAAKAIVKFAEGNDKLEVVAAGLGGNVLDAKGVEALSKLPSLDELRGKLIGVIQAPATKVAGVVQAPASQLARVFSAKAEKGEAA